MSALLIVSFNLKNPEKMQQYATAVAPLLAEHKAELVVKGEALLLSGSSQYGMRTVISFESRDSALAWYKSDAYQRLIPIRDQAIDAQFTLIG
ncbi:DUF1330 domain-containing protein [Reinekea sp. G2M2-21]|uniref:DUF1330 domain-containing protein n=1 Tax=Reinekea sp. G2M2-21 TaxID=2788942 RepID=UPI0018AB7413|nr:DUF1330 domain-containing protein [Reinekea sp. G2M2-21]